jgi:MFS family permease
MGKNKVNMQTVSKEPSWKNFIICSIYFAFTVMQSSMYGILNIELTEILGLSPLGFSSLSSFFWGAVAFSLIPFGVVCDKKPLRMVILVSVGISAIAAFSFYISQSYIVCLFNRIACGVANASAFIGGMQVINLWYRKNSMLMLGLFFMIGNMGAMLVLGPYVYLKTITSWQLVLLVNFILILVIFIVAVLFFAKDEITVSHGKSLAIVDEIIDILKRIRLSIKDLNNWLCGICAGLLALPQVLLGSLWGIVYLTKRFSLTEIEAGTIIMALMIGLIFGPSLFGWFAEINRKIKILIQISTVFCLLLMLAIIYAEINTSYLLFILFMLLGMGVSVQVLTILSAQLNSPKHNVSTALSFVALLTNIVITGALPIFGFLIKYAGYNQMTYTVESFKWAMMIFPISLLVCFFLVIFIKDVKTA